MKKHLTIFVAIIGFATPLLAGGGWTQPKGKGFLKISQGAIIADRYFTPAGDLVDITTTALYTSAVYLEYGLTDRLSTVAYVPFFVRSTLNKVEVVDSNGALLDEEPGDELNAIGDVDLSIKYGLITEGPLVLSASLTLGLPLGEQAGGQTELLQSGDGEFNQLVTLELSRGLASGFYWTLLAGFNNRTNNFSDEFRYGGEIGWVNEKWIPIIKVYGIASLMNGDDAFVPNNGVFGNNIEFLSVTPELNYQMNDKMGISVSAGFAAFGKRVLGNPNFIAGIYFRL